MVDSRSEILTEPTRITDQMPQGDVVDSSPSSLKRAFVEGLVRGLERYGATSIIKDLASGRLRSTELTTDPSELILELPKTSLEKYNPNAHELSRLNKYRSLTTEELRDRSTNQGFIKSATK